METDKGVLVYGGAGQLGGTVVSHFKQAGYTTYSVDFRPNEDAHHNFVLSPDVRTKENTAKVVKGLKDQNATLDAVICVAGGWLGGNVKEESIFDGVDKMFEFNVQSSIASAHIAANSLKEGGVVVLTGADAALGPTPSMIAYGITKVDSSVLGILPICLDTPTNRKSMPGANFDDWTPLPVVAGLLLGWAEGKDRPKSGTLISIATKNKETRFTVVQPNA
ncbi:dihydropteridine reductase [Acanthamoeba castellanii str. Neff]|uniref:Dihydropteridine reductase n=1 Tax=Acanthamoeba castellanii (strain ATCC 30010 / Neff) TaxID=1257118 RepID=L8GSH9_ACACF|nr:dihydropteridine reductase [Acanthamoeba castellanii str. Neff]ELR16129.1 dihydropteridine reductase [Acanthamoeba castellanii str. Neff]